jgi:hypothetical protein
MKQLISLKFPNPQILSLFQQETKLSECVVVGNMVSCDLTIGEIELAKELGGKILNEVSEQQDR